mmetsp:Transcript_38557/g.46623  ORF Transcript_38557/g.46623 Transcript_38557/m.46623 type:complete len:385 (-) Transcript_38557:86-1240(-)|eukprot:CAMPEP_0197852284 /NCGR_PEP_ID=MMETSP1438-20131217/20174_1 /TAXON_ID=1461541 /ORGANISM="Pterosperma sp., Strain CCMP1384" /LENGTH=384 /DNA_ID=CAMNT_0043466251 /DNA_START=187 /DNA_END=1341 /DNA_ORIENTATION=+
MIQRIGTVVALLTVLSEATVGATRGLSALGPKWTYSDMEKPLGEKDMGGWTAAVYTPEQQARLGVTELGEPAPKQASSLPSFEETEAFLKEYQSSADKASVTTAYLTSNIILALQAVSTAQWPQPSSDIFLNDISPYAIFTEPRTEWRQLMFNKISPLLVNVTDLPTAINIVNDKAWTMFTGGVAIKFIAAPPDEVNNYSVFETIYGKYTNGAPGGSCTALAIFLISALRSVGIGARANGVPHWDKGKKVCPNGDADPPCGDHTWVEVHDGTGWHFLSPPSAGIDKGWFFPYPTNVQTPLAGNHSIYATSWRKTTSGSVTEDDATFAVDHYPMVWRNRAGVDQWNDHTVNAFDVTCHYVPENDKCKQALQSPGGKGRYKYIQSV